MPNLPKTVRRSWQGPEKKPFERAQRNKMLYTYRWAKISRNHRANNPLCEECKREGKTMIGSCVDHINPVMAAPNQQEREQRMWDVSNMQTLCEYHHNKKSQSEK